MDSRQTSPGENTILFREIYKNGWLRKTTKTDRETDRFWVAFCVHDDVEPRIEGFVDQKQSTTHSPIWAHSLRNIQHLSPTLCATSRHDYEFCINFNDDHVLRFAAPTYQIMLEWVQIITRKLTDMKVLRPKENVYSRGPERIATRDPTSPLPPPPLLSGSLWISTESIEANTPPNLAADGNGPNQNSENIFTFEDITIDERQPRSSQAQNNRARLFSSTRTTTVPSLISTVTTNSNSNSNYENIFLASSTISSSMPSTVSSNVNSLNNPLVNRQSENHVEREAAQTAAEPSSEQYAALIECRSSETPETSYQTNLLTPCLSSSNHTNAARVFNITNASRQLTLREQQIMQLKREMSHRAGVRVQLGRRECKEGIAFVDTFGSIWVGGWKYREYPMLYNVLHVGDMVISIAGVRPINAAAIREILKGMTNIRVEVIVRRLPYAKAMILTKRTGSEEFGLEMNGNELSAVFGIALNSGLSPLADATDPTAPDGSPTTWTLTEVNGRPLNMFDGCASERLRAIGRDISIVVQPTDLIASLRNKLRAIRNYKNFILQ